MDESLPLQHELDELERLREIFEEQKTVDEEEVADLVSSARRDAIRDAFEETRNMRKAYVMQAWKLKVVARRIYHQGPPDLLEVIIRHCKETPWPWMSMWNELRLVSKRCKQAVHAMSTKLRFIPVSRPPSSVSLPGALKGCNKIESITFDYPYGEPIFTSLEGCPASLKELRVALSWEFYKRLKLSDLSPLSSCAMLEKVTLTGTSIKDLSPLASCPNLKDVNLCGNSELNDLSPLSSCAMLEKVALADTSITNLSPLASCPKLKDVNLCGNRELNDLSPLSACSALEDLDICLCPLITSLAPLSTLQHLKRLQSINIHPETSLLPLASCTGLKELWCNPNAVELDEIMRRRPQMKVCHPSR